VGRHVAPHYSDSETITSYSVMLYLQQRSNNFIVFGFTCTGLECIIYCTRGGHPNNCEVGIAVFMYLAIWLFKLKLPNHSSQHQGKGEYNSKKPHWTFCIPFSSFLYIVINMIPSETLHIQNKQWKENKCCSKSKCNPSFHIEIFMCKDNVRSNIVKEK